MNDWEHFVRNCRLLLGSVVIAAVRSYSIFCPCLRRHDRLSHLLLMGSADYVTPRSDRTTEWRDASTQTRIDDESWYYGASRTLPLTGGTSSSK